jgi:hypothetical protein
MEMHMLSVADLKVGKNYRVVYISPNLMGMGMVFAIVGELSEFRCNGIDCSLSFTNGAGILIPDYRTDVTVTVHEI